MRQAAIVFVTRPSRRRRRGSCCVEQTTARRSSGTLSAVRSAGQPVQIASSNTHTVKPCSPDGSSSPLRSPARRVSVAGGRLDYVPADVAALVYRRRLHFVTVFMWRPLRPKTRPSA
jgi:hypothetical protein